MFSVREVLSDAVRIDPRRLMMAVVGNGLCGFSIGMLVFADFGIDPYNTGMMCLWHHTGLFNFGTFFMCFALLLFAVNVIFLDRSKFGISTLMGMFLSGYATQFSIWLWAEVFGEGTLPIRAVFLVAGVVLVALACSMYYCSNLGVSPNDAIPIYISEHTNWKFRYVRMACDGFWALVGLIGHEHLGLTTLFLALCLGPFIEMFNHVNRRILTLRRAGDLQAE